MSHKFVDFVENEHPGFTGTGEFSDAGMTTPTARLSITSALATGDTCFYVAIGRDSLGNDAEGIEVGYGVKTSTGLQRNSILASSNGGATVSWATAAKVAVMLTAPSAQLLQLDSKNACLLPVVATSPAIAAPAANFFKFYARGVAGRTLPYFLGPTGLESTLQEKLSLRNLVLYRPDGGANAGGDLGLSWTWGGTISHPTPSSSAPAVYNQMKRSRFANIATTQNQFLGGRTATAEKTFWGGNAAGLGGWNFHCRFAIGLWPAATVRLFIGLNDSNAGWAISDTLTGNGCGLWHDTTEAASVLNFVTRDGTTANKTAITLAANLAAGQCFDFWMACPPNSTQIYYKLVELNTGTTRAESSKTTNSPLNSAFLGPELAMSNGTANTTVTTTAVEICAMSCESDY